MEQVTGRYDGIMDEGMIDACVDFTASGFWWFGFVEGSGKLRGRISSWRTWCTKDISKYHSTFA